MIDWLSSLLTNFGLIGLPYASVALCVSGFIHRYRKDGQSITSLSNQSLEADRHFWASVPFHYGILAVLTIHLLCWLLPTVVIWWTASGIRLVALEFVAVSLGLTALVGLGLSTQRGWRVPSIRRLMTSADWVVYALLGIQIVTGILTAVFHPWGTPWLAAAGAPYLRSILLLNPDSGSIINGPLLVRLHVVNGFILVALLPYTKLSHILVLRLSCLWRAPIAFRRGGKERFGEVP
jgi:nitrate reductase gamma subunit